MRQSRNRCTVHPEILDGFFPRKEKMHPYQMSIPARLAIRTRMRLELLAISGRCPHALAILPANGVKSSHSTRRARAPARAPPSPSRPPSPSPWRAARWHVASAPSRTAWRRTARNCARVRGACPLPAGTGWRCGSGLRPAASWNGRSGTAHARAPDEPAPRSSGHPALRRAGCPLGPARWLLAARPTVSGSRRKRRWRGPSGSACRAGRQARGLPPASRARGLAHRSLSAHRPPRCSRRTRGTDRPRAERYAWSRPGRAAHPATRRAHTAQSRGRTGPPPRQRD